MEWIIFGSGGCIELRDRSRVLVQVRTICTFQVNATKNETGEVVSAVASHPRKKVMGSIVFLCVVHRFSPGSLASSHSPKKNMHVR